MRRLVITTALTTCLLAVALRPESAVARDADQVLGELAEVMKAPGQTDKKQALLGELAGIGSLDALNAAIELQITGYYGGSPGVRELGIYAAP